MSSIVIVFLLNFYYFFICLSEANYGRLFFPLILSPLIACLSRVVLDFRWLVCYAVVSNAIPLCINVSDRVLGHHLDIGHPVTTANGMLYSHNSTIIG